MATLKIELTGDGIIDNAAIYLEDPQESIEYKLNPISNFTWDTTVALPIQDLLDYSLYVVAFSGTHFVCRITNLDNNHTIEFDGITGNSIKNRANVVGSQNF